MAIQAVIFDIEGVLLQQTDLSSIRTWENRLDLDEGELVRLINRSGVAEPATLGKISAREAWDRIGERLGLSEDEVRELEGDFWSGYELNSELVDLLQNLRTGYKTATLSDAWSDAREVLADRYGLDKLVDTMIFSYEAGLTKRDVRIFQLATYRLDVSPEEIIYLDDDVMSVDLARLLGMQAIRYRDNAQAITDIQKRIERGR